MTKTELEYRIRVQLSYLESDVIDKRLQAYDVDSPPDVRAEAIETSNREIARLHGKIEALLAQYKEVANG